MKLGIVGAVIAAAGAALGVEGLVYSGGVWLVGGMALAGTLTAVRGRRDSSISAASLESEPAGGPLHGTSAEGYHDSWWTFVLTLVMGLASMAIGLFAVGFDGELRFLRWLPFAVGLMLTAIGLTSIAFRRDRRPTTFV